MGGRRMIFDALRKKFVALTPEEWVRQNFVGFLIDEKGYPAALLANEVSLKINGMSRRCDTVVYDVFLRPVMIIEYKAPDITIEENVFAQISRYNMALRVDYLIVSNGLTHFCCHINYAEQTYSFLDHIPSYEEITLENR
jgi:hypothetical protein